MENSKIEWTDCTFNPWIGCAKVSPGCQHCYAETLMNTRMGRVEWGPNGTRVRTSASYWKQPLRWNEEAMRNGERKRVFCGSLCDVFEDREDLEPWRIDLMKLIEKTPYLDWLLLTKRPENVKRMIEKAQEQSGAGVYADVWIMRTGVWIGTSVENQEQADKRIPHLLSIPACVRFLSMEPLLGPVDLGFGEVMPGRWQWMDHGSLHWVIVGGESGHNARPMHPEWVRSIKRQCQAAGVPFFFKQWGEWGLADYLDVPSVWVDEDTGAIVVRTLPRVEPPPFRSAAVMKRIGKHAAGRLLDGREWNEFPEATR